ncbi:MAG TPA: nucleoside-diphosphate sugar epimerase/dehydratase [Tepidisphaeraceae bacterium]|nr:nucleoside-diphosphate sugar epimerase/dehydratase [Tepidisphaeraceae bacterium]
MLTRVRALLLRKSAEQLRGSPEVEQLLGRTPVNLNTPELQRFLAGKRIAITGAGGSIGSEICRQAARFLPERLILLERSENALFEIDNELRERWLGVDVRPCLADITDASRVDRVFAEHQPHLVFHAAAHKHVPMMEHNPGEAIKNNVFGTKIVVDSAIRHGVDAFVLISTDKAVNPTSVMGATKRLAEMIVQSRDVEAGSRTRLLAVRFGNVLNSSGSVVPIFKRQIASGGPVTVTHPEMRRYFMTIPEATQLVMQAGAIGGGGEVFVLDMGQPMRILDLAQQMIRQAGLVEGKDIEIRFTGMRPGEKLFEELASDDQRTAPTSHAKIRVWDLPVTQSRMLENRLERLDGVIDAPTNIVIETLRSCVPEFQPSMRGESKAEIEVEIEPKLAAQAA